MTPNNKLFAINTPMNWNYLIYITIFDLSKAKSDKLKEKPRINMLIPTTKLNDFFYCRRFSIFFG